MSHESFVHPNMMRSAVVLVAILTAFLVFVQGAPKEVVPFRQAHLRSPKRESSSLILGGRFGRSCFLEAGGCLGKRSMKLPQLRFMDQRPFDNPEINSLPLDSVNENGRFHHHLPSIEDLNMKELSSDDYTSYEN